MSDFETTFSRSWAEVGAKNLSEMRGLRVIFSTSLRRCEKYDFEQPSNVFPMFFDFEGLDFGGDKVYFSVFFRTRFVQVFFSILGGILVQMGAQMGAKIDGKII